MTSNLSVKKYSKESRRTKLVCILLLYWSTTSISRTLWSETLSLILRPPTSPWLEPRCGDTFHFLLTPSPSSTGHRVRVVAGVVYDVRGYIDLTGCINESDRVPLTWNRGWNSLVTYLRWTLPQYWSTPQREVRRASDSLWVVPWQWPTIRVVDSLTHVTASPWTGHEVS